MIPVSTLYDEYIDRRKLTEQKNPFEYIVPPTLKRGRNNYICLQFINIFKTLHKYIRKKQRILNF